MTETPNTTTIGEQTAPELSGVDLARAVLHQAREAAKARGEGRTRKTKRRTGTTVRRDGREPTGFAAVLQGLMADRAWDIPAAGGSILDQWPDIAAALSPNLTCETITAPTAVTTPETPVKTRDMAPPGFHRALAAHQSVAPVQRVDPGITEAIERQNQAMRELSRRAFPETAVAPDDAPAPIKQARAQQRREAAATEAAALRRARTERAAQIAGVPARHRRRDAAA
ncbi:DUF721 domain-containing protein [Streptomyces sp. NPDC014646]|uniref:DUF721 domain-containing protein n=1 Tax=Streptomyces sp. NPDC014646 TaxID=3364877 RepID=UPI0036F72C10